MVAADHTRDPCPWVILNDTGAAFAMGAIGGSLWHGIKGGRNSPRGERLPAAIAAIKQRGPTLGGAFGMWGAVFGTSDCIVRSVRQTEDMKNGVIAGFMTGAALAVRSGPKMMLGSGIMCGILLGVMEGMGVLMQRMFAGQNKQVAPIIPDTVPGQA